MNARMLFGIFLISACFLVQINIVLAEPSSISQHQPLKTNKVRAVHFVLRHVSLKDAHLIVDYAHNSSFNTVVVTLTHGIKLDHSPWKPLPDAWSKSDLSAWVNYVRSKGMEVIPEVKLLTHQEKFFQKKLPGLMFNKATYDPRSNNTYALVFPLLDEVISLIHPKAIHIGHDEVAGHNKHSRKKWLGHEEKMIPANLFLEDVLRVYSYLKKQDIETWMWGDMLISPNEFTSMLARHLHGTETGYGKALRDKLPKDIVICDWHYFDGQLDFPSLSVMQNEGFRVIGTTWKKENTIRNFSGYAKQNNAYGMMATTWWHVQKKQWDIVGDIITKSGLIFGNE